MHGTAHVPCSTRHPHRGLNSGHGHLQYGVWDLVRDRSSVRDASAGLETMNSGGQDIDFWAQQVVLGADKLHAGTADSFLYGRPSPPTHQPSPTHHRVHPVPPSPRHPPAPVYLRELNALSGLPHGITSYIRDLDLVSGPEYHAGSRHGVVTVETALAVHTLKGVLLHWRSEDALGRRRTATQCGIQCGIRDLARDPWFHGG